MSPQLPDGQIHLWNNCNGCGQTPLLGKRYECQTCPIGPDSDFCEACYQRIQQGQLAHPKPDNYMSAHLTDVAHHFKCYEGSPAQEAAPWFEIPMPQLADPTIPDGFVVRPEFLAGYESTFAGYSFVVNAEGFPCPLLLTAYHVMDEMLRKKGVDASGDNPAYTGRELPAYITGVNLYNLFAANWMVASMGKAGAMLILPDARIKEQEPKSSLDIAAFRIPDASLLQPRQLAENPPAVGQPVWMVASHGRGNPKRVFKAVVVHVSEEAFIYRFEDQKIPSYTSGAPLLNDKGLVVAINVGGGDLADVRFGHGNHVTNIRRHLKQAH